MITIDCTPIPKPVRKSKKSRASNAQKEKYSRVVNPFAIKQARREYCVNCGISATSVTYEVHHIKPKGSGGHDEPENLINLCSGPNTRERGGCHQLAHAKLISADHLREMNLMDIKQREGRI